jgi:hypothetical protein
MALVWFDGVTSLALRIPGTAWKRRPTKPPDEAVDVLELLGIDKEVFTRRPIKVSPPVPPEARPSRSALSCRHDLGPPHPPLSPARSAGPAQLRAAARPRRPRA